METKILVIGHDLTVQRLAIALGLTGIEVDSLKAELPLDLASLETQRYDLILIDSRINRSHLFCRLLFQALGTPVYLLLSRYSDDWNTIAGFSVDGFIDRDVSDTEIRTRVKAACRRRATADLPSGR